MFLNKYGLTEGDEQCIQINKGREPTCSENFQKGSGNMATVLNQLEQIMFRKIAEVNVPTESLAILSDALLYTVAPREMNSGARPSSRNVINYTYNTALRKTPFEAWGVTKPNLNRIWIFRTPVVTVKKTGQSLTKGRPYIYHDIFLLFTGGTKNMIYLFNTYLE